MKYYLNAEALRVVQRNDRGIVTYRKRYRRGDEVDVSKMDEAHVQNLVDDKRLVASEDDVVDEPTAPVSPITSDRSATPTGDLGSTAVTSGDTPGDTGADAVDPDAELVDEYSDMDYATLQQTAKSRDLNAGGSAEDLRNRLREADAGNDDGDE